MTEKRLSCFGRSMVIFWDAEGAEVFAELMEFWARGLASVCLQARSFLACRLAFACLQARGFLTRRLVGFGLAGSRFFCLRARLEKLFISVLVFVYSASLFLSRQFCFCGDVAEGWPTIFVF